MSAALPLSELLSIKYPVIQAPMLGVTTPAMVAAIANEGGLGSLPVGGLSPQKTAELIQLTREKTSKPFAVNLFTHAIRGPVDQAQLDTIQAFMKPIHDELGIPFEYKSVSDFAFYHYRDQLEVLLNEKIRIVSFTFGMLEPDVTELLKSRGCKLIGTATSVREASMLDQLGVDAIVAQGFEAGGHRGSFLTDEALPQVGLMALLPQLVAAVSVPVIAAGGLYNDQTIKAAFTLGAAGVQLGSMFIACDESAASEVYKEAVLSSGDTSTALTKAFSGRWARGIRNGFMERIEHSGIEIPYYTYQNSLTSAMRTYGQQHNLCDYISLWAGQSAAHARRGKAGEIFLSLIEKLNFDF
ncbi:NAD(P)H-dependent flavin oxidoreductase [Dyadobacter sediminis]|uniref:Nitronate monooxygenase n=1 Tax=Dyadobacter sediminis TaxID=1493691 RepID=A0A5R9KJQ2_9BACT|nr:nitronate monooxygenase [Dyadobacter sediminis]TLU96414.1 nitronate monooxygenase [Dyadobacter sediminis]GGB82038.1 nitronate monooxygenase [Dyadobacter sediminis]